jgi:two-component system chemotaxis response regulator CheY
VVRNLLEQIGGIESREAKDGLHALEMLRSGGYNLVISAWNMPGMDGLQLLRSMKDDPLLDPIPFLITTTQAAKTKVMEAMKAGVDGYLVEPFTAEGLREKIEELAGRPGTL